MEKWVDSSRTSFPFWLFTRTNVNRVCFAAYREACYVCVNVFQTLTFNYDSLIVNVQISEMNSSKYSLRGGGGNFNVFSETRHFSHLNAKVFSIYILVMWHLWYVIMYKYNYLYEYYDFSRSRACASGFSNRKLRIFRSRYMIWWSIYLNMLVSSEWLLALDTPTLTWINHQVNSNTKSTHGYRIHEGSVRICRKSSSLRLTASDVWESERLNKLQVETNELSSTPGKVSSDVEE
jgi:hypothetical protein